MLMVLLSILVVIILFALNVYDRKFHYWRVRGVPGPKPQWIFGNVKESFFNRKTPLQIFSDLYTEYEGLPFIGAFNGSKPCLIIRDPDLIKEFTVKEFNSFHNNDIHVDKRTDPLYGRNPFVLKGEEWKFTRSCLRPFFTTSKMKKLFPLLRKGGLTLVDLISNHCQRPLEAKAVALRFTLNNVTSCALGLENQNDELQTIVESFSQPEHFSTIKVFALPLVPFLSKIFPFKYTPRDAEVELISIVETSLKIRREHGVVQNDFLHYLSSLEENAKLSNLEIAAHVAGFFMDGYETSATILSFALYELARTPDVQSELREQIQLKFKYKKKESISYEDIEEIGYLDAVVSESLRLNPPVFSLGKTCTKDHKFTSSDGRLKDFLIEKGLAIYLPIFQIHRDPKYFASPEEFDPDRFLPANKGNIRKYTYLPFGEGPRSCLGQKFGILQVKIALFFILKNFVLTLNSKSTVPFRYDSIYFISSVESGLWIDFQKISRSKNFS